MHRNTGRDVRWNEFKLDHADFTITQRISRPFQHREIVALGVDLQEVDMVDAEFAMNASIVVQATECVTMSSK